jgi:hypothetical protein
MVSISSSGQPIRCHHSSRVSVFLLALIFTACGLHGQEVASAAAPAPPISVTAEVSLDLLVHDEKNRPVLDLQSTQIAVTDDGTPVKLSSLRLVKADAAPSEHKVTLVFDRLDSAGDKNAEIPPQKSSRSFPRGSRSRCSM